MAHGKEIDRINADGRCRVVEDFLAAGSTEMRGCGHFSVPRSPGPGSF